MREGEERPSNYALKADRRGEKLEKASKLEHFYFSISFCARQTGLDFVLVLVFFFPHPL